MHHRSVLEMAGDFARIRFPERAVLSSSSIVTALENESGMVFIMRLAARPMRHEDVVLAMTETGGDHAVHEGRVQAEISGSSLVVCRVTHSAVPDEFVTAATPSEIVIRHGDLATVAAEEADKRNVRMIVVDATDEHHLRATAAELVVRHARCS